MSDAIHRFFDAWAGDDAAARAEAVKGAMAADFAYADQKTKGQIKDAAKLSAYIDDFGATGWGARVMKVDSVAGFDRVLVGFGPDGAAEQTGQSFVKCDKDGRIRRMVGFVGTGAPE